MVVKLRSEPGSFETSERSSSWFDTPWLLTSVDRRTKLTYSVHQAITTEGHPFHLLGRNHEGDIGGPFSNHKIEINLTPEGSNNRVPGNWDDSDGYFADYIEGLLVPSELVSLSTDIADLAIFSSKCPPAFSDNYLDSMGATAVSLCAPTSPLADAASTIGELKDRFPSIPGTSGNIGAEYLNIVFGLQPLVSELNAYRESWEKSEELLAQFERDSGKRVRRRFEFDTEVVVEKTLINEPPTLICGQQPTVWSVRWTPRERVRTKKTKIWFSGAFTYHLPKSGWRRTLAELDYLYGIKPGIDTAWELTPWSWLVDWQTNVGDVLQNINAFSSDGLVMPYGYVMASQTWEDVYFQEVEVSDKGVFKKRTLAHTVTTSTHQRRPANPFGFGLTLEDLTVRQGAILAALGISRLR